MFIPGVGEENLTSEGDRDIFIQKLDSDGNFLWVNQMGEDSFDAVSSITTDVNGNVYTTGHLNGEISLYSEVTIFIRKLDSSGNFLWEKHMKGINSANKGNSIATDIGGCVYTTGTFSGIVDFNPGAGEEDLTSEGGADIFIQKLDSEGNFLWVKRMGGSSSDSGNSISLDINGNIYTTGHFTGTVDFDPGTSEENLTSEGGTDIFIQKLEASTLGLPTYNKSSSFTVYPNPTNGSFTIDLAESYEAPTITMTDLLGRVIQSKTYNENHLLSLKLEEPAGIYLLIVKSEDKKTIIRLIKE